MLDKSFDPQEAEARLYEMWESSGAFKPRMDTSREAYSIVIPPPNVTGSLHMGHAVNNTLQDILIRFERMRGKDVLWQPGTDHAGIATQMVVERKLASEGNKGRKDMTREEFVEKVWDWKHESGGNISQQLRRLGASCDWSREKFTLGNPDDPSDKMAEAVTQAFVEMYDAGLIYRDKRLVNWDPHFQTAISDLEVENREVDGHFWHFKYPLDGGETYEYVEKDEDGNITLRETRDYISIATTRPETMLGDGAVAVHPDDERYAPIVGKMVRLPLANRLIPIITDEYPDMDFGSGAVKITGAHDFNDYEVAKRNDIPMYSLMDEQARMLASDIMPEKYVGMDRFVARKAVVKDIDAEGFLIATEDKKVMQPFGDRSNVVIEPMLTDQWYVDAKSLAGDAIAAVERGHNSSTHHPHPSTHHPREGGDPSPESAASGVGGRWIPASAGMKDGEDSHTPHTAHPREGGDPSPENAASGEGGRWVPASTGMKEGGEQGSTRFFPPTWKKTYDNWMNDIQPWCISRQLWWGHRIPAWFGPKIDNKLWGGLDYGSSEKTIFCAASWDDVKKLAKEYYGRDIIEEFDAENFGARIALPTEQVADFAKNNSPIEDFHMDLVENHCCGIDKVVALERDPDVLDTWFSSGLWPFSTLGWPDETPELARFYPGSVLVTAFDIIFFWVARMMMQGLHFMGEVPFKDVYIHAIVRDENGQKMSKSEGNVIDPVDLIEGIDVDTLVAKRTTGLRKPETAPKVAKATRKQYPNGFEPYGADALRFTLAAMAAAGRDIKLSVKRVEGYRNFGTKLWSAASYGQMKDCRLDGAYKPEDFKLPLNRWIVSETARTLKSVTKNIETYRFNDAADAIYKFTWDTFCAWYLELTKPVLNGDDAAAAAETRAAYAWTLDQILRMLHPFMPFITEDIWSKTSDKRDSMLILADWPELPETLIDDAACEEIDTLQTIITNLRSVRADMNVPPSRKAPLIVTNAPNKDIYRDYAESLDMMGRVSDIEFSDALPDGSIQIVVGDATLGILIADLIDMDAERARLSKEIEKTEGEIAKIDKKLSNPNFTERAPEAVVAEQHSRREGFSAELAKLTDALANLE